MMFSFYGKHDLGPRLKSYRASTVGGKSTITIVCEVSDHLELGFALRELAGTVEAQKKSAAAAKAAKKPKPKAPLLALPAPLRALPAPQHLIDKKEGGE